MMMMDIVEIVVGIEEEVVELKKKDVEEEEEVEVELLFKKWLVLGEKWWRKIVYKEVGYEKNFEEEEKEKEENDDDECYVVGEDEYNFVVFDIMEVNIGMLFVCIVCLNGYLNEEFVILNVYEWE